MNTTTLDPYYVARARQAAILARPAVAAILAQARALTDEQRAALHVAHLPHYRIHRRSRSNLLHRFVKTVGAPHWRDAYMAVTHVEEVARGGLAVYEGEHWTADDAVGDAVHAVILGKLLTDAEALVFTGPWLAVFGSLPAPITLTHRAHPATSGPFCIAYDERAGVRIPGHPSTFVGADVTCPACLVTYERGGDDPATLVAAARGEVPPGGHRPPAAELFTSSWGRVLDGAQ